MNTLDISIFRWLNQGTSSSADILTICIAEFLPWILLGSLLLFIALGRNKRRELFMVLYALFAGVAARYGVAKIIRYFYDSPRPFEVLDDIRQLLFHGAGGSFPSGHASFFFAVAMAIFLYRKWYGLLFFALALLIGLARVAGGIHWPSDIVGGAIVGIGTAWVIKLILTRVTRE